MAAGDHSDHTARGYHHRRRAESTRLAIDLSSSMDEAMEGRTKIAVVEQAVLQLLLYKQQLFS